MLGADSLEEGREVPDTWLGFPLRSFVAGLFTAGRKTVSAQLSSVDGERTFEVTGIPAAGAETALVVVQDVSERELRGRAEREFVSNAAHELRTPLASITSAIERLQAGARDIPEKRDRYLGHIQHESARLNRLAASLLVLARAETGEEEPRREQIVLCGLLAELTGSLEIAPDVELVLECPADLVVQSNRDLLEHALVNLVGNAARHTERGQIRLAARAGADGSVTIEIADTGTGIEAAEFSRLFDRFYRGPGEDRSGGFGLGLPITKEAVQAIGGRIEIESTAGVGTTARIALPGAAVEALA
jgi:signal transduction histidine kinase